jgi:hypothetical protein
MTWQRALELASSVISLPYTLHLKPFAVYSYLYIYGCPHSPIRSLDFEAFHALSLITDQALTPFSLTENQPIKADFETLLCQITSNVNYLAWPDPKF